MSLLGATAGSSAGNVRAVLALASMLLLHAMFGGLLTVVVLGHGELRDFLLTVGSALVAVDTAAVSFYVGRRAGESP